MKTRISALMDGELERHEVVETLQALRRSEDLRTEWRDGHLIGAACAVNAGSTSMSRRASCRHWERNPR